MQGVVLAAESVPSAGGGRGDEAQPLVVACVAQPLSDQVTTTVGGYGC